MVDAELYIKEGLKVIKTLVDQGNLATALHSCQELLKVNPYHKKVQSYLEFIEKKMVAQNDERVSADIESTMHLWKEGRYDDLLKIYTRLYYYSPNHKKLRSLIQKLTERFTEQQKLDRTQFIHQALTAIAGLYKDKRFGDVIQACNELIGVDPLNDEAKSFLEKAKNALIDQKLKENERLLDSADFERIYEFCQSLLTINPKHTKLKQIAFGAQAHLAEQKILAEKIHLNESIARMKDLFKNAEYEKVLQACEEIDRLDPKNFTARLFRKKTLSALATEIDTQTQEKLKKEVSTLGGEYQKNPAGFVIL